MKEISLIEMTKISGAGGLIDGDFNGAFWGALLGAIDGFGTGAAVGGKYGGAGGWLIGGIAQLVGLTACAVGAGIGGYLYGGILGYDKAKPYIASYREM
ncbi:DUF5862 family protein [Rosenbergiella epipactidis]|uniref:DUF5862 family protein n=1 Tax=Rosenbergiella epipactidis TaxID=1544694 RepID=UPI001F4E519B|nr:hypothetical protein [Rosenbergiella epipactidis]